MGDEYRQSCSVMAEIEWGHWRIAIARMAAKIISWNAALCAASVSPNNTSWGFEQTKAQ
jgi:hypothetical protein